jgi:UDP-N-acetylmuramate: L-alanyl-gamma-D-glutamyl-meso-diaminopimelate ligase
MADNFKTIHFIGICGSAMGSVAAMLKETGCSVQGSDNELYPPMSDYLHDAGIKVFDGFSPDNVTKDVDLVVVGNAISRGNFELEYVLDKKIRYTSFPKIVKEFFIRDSASIVVTGTHGKTTTSSLISWILHNAGKDTGFLIGGIVKNFNKGFSCPKKGGYFVVEGDEYDTAFFDKRSKFLHYLPDVLIINNLEFDHADIFKDIDDIKKSFKHLIRTVPSTGTIAANADDDNVCEIIKEVYSNLKTFAIRDKSADYRAANISYSADRTEFDIVKGKKTVTKISTTLKGDFNVYNILAAFTALDSLGIGADEFQNGLNGFKNVKRRLEKAGVVNGILVYDDFAHHPTAIKKTISAVKKAYPDKRIIALFEPKSNTSRRNFFQDELSTAFTDADIAVIAGVYNYEKMSENERLDPFKLVEDIKKSGTDAHYIADIDELSNFAADSAKTGDIILAMSSGSFYGVHQKILNRLKENWVMLGNLLDIRGLQVKIKDGAHEFYAVDGIDLSIPPGGAHALVGESGCGKSITAYSIMGLLPNCAEVTRGRVSLCGEDLRKKDEPEMEKIRGRKMGMIFQEPLSSLDPVFTIYNQISEAITLHENVKGKELKKRVAGLLKRVHIPDAKKRLKSYPHQLSGGMRQRVMIASAISLKPVLLIADEPTTALDVTIQLQILKLLKELKDEMGMALFLITHDLGVVSYTCSHVSVMYAGRIVESCSTEELFANPLHPYTKALLNSIPKGRSAGKKLETIKGSVPSMSNIPEGCRFNTRCELADESCREEDPKFIEVKDGHYAACIKI